MDALMTAEWRGNVRELKNVLESAAVMSADNVIQPEDLPAEFLTGHGLAPAGSSSPEFLSLADFREARKQFEIAYIRAKLREHGGNITRTAAAIGLHRQSLQEKLRELGIRAERNSEA
jgi:DNA-binding NtrC family response regulator